MSRYKAAFIHLLISAVLVGGVVGVVFWVWYPDPTFEVLGAFSIIQMLVAVDLVLGPTLTMIVFKDGKPGLKFDLTMIALVQICALVYGSYTLYTEKPLYLVFAVDRVEFVARKDVDQAAIGYEELRQKSFGNLIRVFAKAPDDPVEFQKYFDSVLEGQPDLERRGEFYHPWKSGADTIRDRIKPIEKIIAVTPREQENVRVAIEQYHATHPNLGILPVGGIERNVGMLMDGDTLEILGVLDANPWKIDEVD